MRAREYAGVLVVGLLTGTGLWAHASLVCVVLGLPFPSWLSVPAIAAGVCLSYGLLMMGRAR